MIDSIGIIESPDFSYEKVGIRYPDVRGVLRMYLEGRGITVLGMSAPIAKIGDTQVEAKSYRVNDINEFANSLYELVMISDNKTVIFYTEHDICSLVALGDDLEELPAEDWEIVQGKVIRCAVY